MLNLKNKKGFTLVELLIVIAVIAILVAISIPHFNSYRTNSKKKTAIANARTCIADAAMQLANNPSVTPTVSYCSLIANDASSCTCSVDEQSATCTLYSNGIVNCF